MNGEETTTLGAVAESQQNISNPTETAPVAEQPAQPVQPEQPTVEENNWTWTSSWGVEQTTQTTPEASTDEILNQVNAILDENKTLDTVAQESEVDRNQKENEDALNDIMEKNRGGIVGSGAITEAEYRDELKEKLYGDKEDIKVSKGLLRR